MEMTQLLPTLRKLKREEKYYVMQFLVAELAQEEGASNPPAMIDPDLSAEHENGVASAKDVTSRREAALALIQSGKFATQKPGGGLASDAFAQRKAVEKELEERRWVS